MTTAPRRPSRRTGSTSNDHEIARLLLQMDRALRGPAWHGPSVLQALRGLSAADAFARPLAGVHTIHEITHHIAAWKRIVGSRLAGTHFTRSDGWNFPAPAPANAARWRRTVAGLERAHRELRRAVAALHDPELEAAVPGRSRYVLIHGVIQHDLYHAGQIVLLRRGLVRARKAAARVASARPKR